MKCFCWIPAQIVVIENERSSSLFLILRFLHIWIQIEHCLLEFYINTFSKKVFNSFASGDFSRDHRPWKRYFQHFLRYHRFRLSFKNCRFSVSMLDWRSSFLKYITFIISSIKITWKWLNFNRKLFISMIFSSSKFTFHTLKAFRILQIEIIMNKTII